MPNPFCRCPSGSFYCTLNRQKMLSDACNSVQVNCFGAIACSKDSARAKRKLTAETGARRPCATASERTASGRRRQRRTVGVRPCSFSSVTGTCHLLDCSASDNGLTVVGLDRVRTCGTHRWGLQLLKAGTVGAAAVRKVACGSARQRISLAAAANHLVTVFALPVG
jgi:hypothetical protein